MENLSNYALLIIPFLFLVILKQYLSHQPQNSPPSPRALPLIGHLHLIKSSLYLSLTSLSSQYGPILSLQLGYKSVVVVSSPPAIEECFTKNDIVFANRPKSVAGDRLTYNYAAFAWSPYGHFWRTLRRLSVVELFSSHSLHNSAKIREQEIYVLLRVLQRVCKTGGRRVDLHYLVSAYSFNHMMRAVAGKRCVGEEDVASEVGKEAVKRIRGTFFTSLSLGICDFFPVLRWIGYKGVEKNLKLLHKKRDEFLQSLIDESRGRNDVSREKKERVLIETLLSLQASEPEFYTDDVIKSIVLILFIAGTETSAVTIEWAMSLLLTHPEELHKLKQEIDNHIGHDHLINDADLAKLPYLRCIINETLRLYPPVPLLLPHYSSEKCTVGGYDVPKGTILMVNAWAMHRDPNIWEEPDKFNPRRFQAMEMEREAWKFVPFGMGRRACPGAAMGLRTISLALGAFVQCFEWEKLLEHEDMDANYNSRIMLQKGKPLEAVCVPRDPAADLLSRI
ncbi:cytochrome P450 81E8-like [Sesamum indicum]|uniref:Cytochrome P450 81E8-like n=1 Tax=Sesamum indicum TaxID=4182 RepID=A0A6I9SVV1_SESIN|nr:cytochrome P450 81E8-like [Sesamum indicum]